MAQRRTTRSSGGWLSFFSFIAVMLLGLALMISFICEKAGWNAGTIPWILERIALGIAIVVPVILSYYEARRKTTVWFVLWVIATVLVIVFYILRWF